MVVNEKQVRVYPLLRTTLVVDLRRVWSAFVLARWTMQLSSSGLGGLIDVNPRTLIHYRAPAQIAGQTSIARRTDDDAVAGLVGRHGWLAACSQTDPIHRLRCLSGFRVRQAIASITSHVLYPRYETGTCSIRRRELLQ